MQDTPSVKYPFSGCITAQNVFNVFASANTTNVTAVDDTYNKTCFKNDLPIASYMLAFAIGNIHYASIGGRVGVIAEPAHIPTALVQFVNLPNILGMVENYLGLPYIWGNFNLLIVPGNYPYGGMENPLLTFFSAAMLNSDKYAM